MSIVFSEKHPQVSWYVSCLFCRFYATIWNENEVVGHNKEKESPRQEFDLLKTSTSIIRVAIQLNVTKCTYYKNSL